MDLSELNKWLAEGTSLELAQFNLPQEQKPAPGTPVVGYRVAYTYTDPNTKETIYGSPLTHWRGDLMSQELNLLKNRLGQTSEYDTFLSSNVPIHNPRESDEGFYYFADQSMAEDYMKMIALGKVNKARSESPINSESALPEKYTGERPAEGLKLTLFRISGVADETMNEFEGVDNRKEGLRMKDMHIDEHLLSIPVEDIAMMGDKLRNMPDDKLGPKNKIIKQWANYH